MLINLNLFVLRHRRHVQRPISWFELLISLYARIKLRDGWRGIFVSRDRVSKRPIRIPLAYNLQGICNSVLKHAIQYETITHTDTQTHWPADVTLECS